MITQIPNLLPIILGAVIGLAAGYVGSLMVLRRMALVGDALSHVALPGLALGLLFNFNPFWGAFGALALSIVLIWLIENYTRLPTETLVGIFFTLSLSLGLLLAPQHELLEILFGDITQVTTASVFWGSLIAIAAIIISRKIYNSLVLDMISKDLAHSLGINSRKHELVYLLVVALVVALGIKIVGILLMGALVIIPAATAKNLSIRLDSYTKLSSIFGLISASLGIYLGITWSLPPGPLVVLVGSLVFFFSLVIRKKG